MEIFDDISFCSPSPCVIALGCFDGVHLGHTAVIKSAVAKAEQLSLPCLVLTFNKPPKSFFSSSAAPLITSKKSKSELMCRLGVSILLSLDFNEKIASLSREEFAERILKDNLRATHIVCGFNYTFGKSGLGSTAFLGDFCRKSEIGLTVIPPLEIDGECVSSSLIRGLIEAGDIERAGVMLGRPYSLSANVIEDKGLARNLGFATANQVFSDGTLLPKNGVYLTRAVLDGISYRAITNIGIRPTVNGKKLCAETHILDFSEDIYSKELEICFLKFIRGEKKFSSVEELRTQVIKDIEMAKKSDFKQQ